MDEFDTSDDEFYMDDDCDESHIDNEEFSDDDLHIDDGNMDNSEDRHNISMSDSGSDIVQRRRRPRPLVFSDDEDEDIIERNMFGDWYNITQNYQPPPIIPFTTGTSSPGAQVDDSVEKPIDFFNLLFTDEIINKIVFETNRYASNKINETTLGSWSTWKNWKPLTFERLSSNNHETA
jgi:hypothetical protein